LGALTALTALTLCGGDESRNIPLAAVDASDLVSSLGRLTSLHHLYILNLMPEDNRDKSDRDQDPLVFPFLPALESLYLEVMDSLKMWEPLLTPSRLPPTLIRAACWGWDMIRVCRFPWTALPPLRELGMFRDESSAATAAADMSILPPSLTALTLACRTSHPIRFPQLTSLRRLVLNCFPDYDSAVDVPTVVSALGPCPSLWELRLGFTDPTPLPGTETSFLTLFPRLRSLYMVGDGIVFRAEPHQNQKKAVEDALLLAALEATGVAQPQAAGGASGRGRRQRLREIGIGPASLAPALAARVAAAGLEGRIEVVGVTRDVWEEEQILGFSWGPEALARRQARGWW
jgi:hypothetical protein